MAQASKDPVSQGYFSREITLATSVAQQIWKRTEGSLPRAFYQLSVNIRFLQEEDQADALDSDVKALLDGLHKEIEAKISECESLMERAGTSLVQGTTAPMPIVVKVTSPRLNRCLNLLLRIDYLNQCFESLWLAEEPGFENGPHIMKKTHVQRLTVGVFQRIVDSAQKAIKTARKQALDRRSQANLKGHENGLSRERFRSAVSALSIAGSDSGPIATPFTESDVTVHLGPDRTRSKDKRRSNGVGSVPNEEPPGPEEALADAHAADLDRSSAAPTLKERLDSVLRSTPGGTA